MCEARWSENVGEEIYDCDGGEHLVPALVWQVGILLQSDIGFLTDLCPYTFDFSLEEGMCGFDVMRPGGKKHEARPEGWGRASLILAEGRRQPTVIHTPSPSGREARRRTRRRSQRRESSTWSGLRFSPTRMHPAVSSGVLPAWMRMPSNWGTCSSRGSQRPKRGE